MATRVSASVTLRLLAVAWLCVAVWRFVVSGQEDVSEFGGLARREHIGLLVLQAFCALLAAGATLGLAEAVGRRERSGRAACMALLAIAVAGFAAIFTKADLLAWGAYEN